MTGRKTISHDVVDYFREWLSLNKQIPTATHLAEQFGILIEITDKSPKRGKLILRSEYSGSPPAIIVYRESISVWGNQLREKSMELKISQAELVEICIFHEICHHLLVYPACFFPQCHIKEIKQIRHSEEEEIIHQLVQVWLIFRFPDYNTHHKLILES